jgi:hypothetical protein
MPRVFSVSLEASLNKFSCFCQGTYPTPNPSKQEEGEWKQGPPETPNHQCGDVFRGLDGSKEGPQENDQKKEQQEILKDGWIQP